LARAYCQNEIELSGETKMECGSWCVYYTSKGVSGACTSCSAYINEGKPRFESGGMNVFELANKLSQKREQERRNKIPQLSDCPNCHKHASFYNIINDKFECLAIECKYTIAMGTVEYKAILIKIYGESE
jgi:hypothetical protein